MLERKSIIVDIDGTLANLDHRLHHLNKPEGARDVETAEESKQIDWDAFHAECSLDIPIKPTCNLVRTLADDDWCIILITGRGGDNRMTTEYWLQAHDIPYDLLLMREPENHEADIDLKKRWLKKLRSGELSVPGMLEPEIVIEDRSRTINMWREEGLIALQCDEGDF